jgi:hypothetical protein
MSSSTTELLLPIIEELQKLEEVELLNEDVATLLLTGIITDTGSFQNANTTPKSFAKAAQLISYGARQQEIIQHIYKTKQLSQLKLWGRVLSKIQTDDKFKIVWSVVSQQDFKDTESHVDQTGDVIDELMTNAPGAEVVVLMKEKEDGSISVSIRTTSPSIDASKIAEYFGGGGHTQAAGFTLKETTIHDAEYKVMQHIREAQSERLGIIASKEDEENKDNAEPMIDVEELINRVEEAQKATDLMPSPEPELPSEAESGPEPEPELTEPEKSSFNPETPASTVGEEEEENTEEEKTDQGTGYRFED